jgi:hypothetical protein
LGIVFEKPLLVRRPEARMAPVERKVIALSGIQALLSHLFVGRLSFLTIETIERNRHASSGQNYVPLP